MSIASKTTSIIKGEPVAIVGSIITAWHMAIAAGLEYGWFAWTAKQTISAEAFVVALLAIPVTLFVRNSVTPNVNIPSLVNSTPWLLGYPDDDTLPVAHNREA